MAVEPERISRRRKLWTTEVVAESVDNDPHFDGLRTHRRQLLGPAQGKDSCYSETLLGTCRSLWAISSIETSRKVSTLALFTNRAGRYMSQTQASAIETS
jgi:hypothetical protein